MSTPKETQPLLGSSQTTSNSVPTTQPPATDSTPPQPGANTTLVLFSVALLLTSVGNSVFFKQMTDHMMNYPFFLSQLSTVVYIPVFFGIVFLRWSEITPEMKAFPKMKFFSMGLLDAFSGVLSMIGAVHTSGGLQALLSNAIIPFTMLLSFLYIGERFNLYQITGSGIITVAVILAVVPLFMGQGGDDENNGDNQLVFVLMFVLNNIPSAFGSVYKEIVFSQMDMNENYLQAWVALFQLILGIFLIPLNTLKMLGRDAVAYHDIGGLLYRGFWCLMGYDMIVKPHCISFHDTSAISDFLEQAGSLPHSSLLPPCDICQGAWIPTTLYLSVNLLYNWLMVVIIKVPGGGAALLYIIMALRLPLLQLAFASSYIQNPPEPITLTNVFVLTLILIGLYLYNSGGGTITATAARLNINWLKVDSIQKEYARITANEQAVMIRNEWISTILPGGATPGTGLSGGEIRRQQERQRIERGLLMNAMNGYGGMDQSHPLHPNLNTSSDDDEGNIDNQLNMYQHQHQHEHQHPNSNSNNDVYLHIDLNRLEGKSGVDITPNPHGNQRQDNMKNCKKHTPSPSSNFDLNSNNTRPRKASSVILPNFINQHMQPSLYPLPSGPQSVYSTQHSNSAPSSDTEDDCDDESRSTPPSTQVQSTFVNYRTSVTNIDGNTDFQTLPQPTLSHLQPLTNIPPHHSHTHNNIAHSNHFHDSDTRSTHSNYSQTHHHHNTHQHNPFSGSQSPAIAALSHTNGPPGIPHLPPSTLLTSANVYAKHGNPATPRFMATSAKKSPKLTALDTSSPPCTKPSLGPIETALDNIDNSHPLHLSANPHKSPDQRGSDLQAGQPPPNMLIPPQHTPIDQNSPLSSHTATPPTQSPNIKPRHTPSTSLTGSTPGRSSRARQTRVIDQAEINTDIISASTPSPTPPGLLDFRDLASNTSTPSQTTPVVPQFSQNPQISQITLNPLGPFQGIKTSITTSTPALKASTGANISNANLGAGLNIFSNSNFSTSAVRLHTADSDMQFSVQTDDDGYSVHSGKSQHHTTGSVTTSNVTSPNSPSWNGGNYTNQGNQQQSTQAHNSNPQIHQLHPTTVTLGSPSATNVQSISSPQTAHSSVSISQPNTNQHHNVSNLQQNQIALIDGSNPQFTATPQLSSIGPGRSNEHTGLRSSIPSKLMKSTKKPAVAAFSGVTATTLALPTPTSNGTTSTPTPTSATTTQAYNNLPTLPTPSHFPIFSSTPHHSAALAAPSLRATLSTSSLSSKSSSRSGSSHNPHNQLTTHVATSVASANPGITRQHSQNHNNAQFPPNLQNNHIFTQTPLSNHKTPHNLALSVANYNIAPNTPQHNHHNNNNNNHSHNPQTSANSSFNTSQTSLPNNNSSETNESFDSSYSTQAYRLPTTSSTSKTVSTSKSTHFQPQPAPHSLSQSNTPILTSHQPIYSSTNSPNIPSDIPLNQFGAQHDLSQSSQLSTTNPPGASLSIPMTDLDLDSSSHQFGDHPDIDLHERDQDQSKIHKPLQSQSYFASAANLADFQQIDRDYQEQGQNQAREQDTMSQNTALTPNNRNQNDNSKNTNTNVNPLADIENPKIAQANQNDEQQETVKTAEEVHVIENPASLNNEGITHSNAQPVIPEADLDQQPLHIALSAPILNVTALDLINSEPSQPVQDILTPPAQPQQTNAPTGRIDELQALAPVVVALETKPAFETHPTITLTVQSAPHTHEEPKAQPEQVDIEDPVYAAQPQVEIVQESQAIEEPDTTVSQSSQAQPSTTSNQQQQQQQQQPKKQQNNNNNKKGKGKRR